MNQVAQIKNDAASKATASWFQANPALAQRGIDESIWNALCSSVFPGAKSESILMAVDYCQARGLDVMLKPVHLVPMSVKDAQTGDYVWRVVPMPGVGLYRIQADRSGTYAGADAPIFGDLITKTFRNKGDEEVTVTFPEYCQYTVHKLIGDRLVSYTATEYWEENYATDSRNSDAPNSMWLKRPRGQLSKCAEAQALRKGWPEIGQEPTAEEMEGKAFHGPRDITPAPQQQQVAPAAAPTPAIEYYPAEKFTQNFPSWENAVLSGKRTHEEIITMANSKGSLTNEQHNAILNIGTGE